MKSKFIITFIFFALAAFGAKAETAVRDTVPVTKRGITPPRNLQNYDPSQAAGKFGQVMGVKRYSGTAGDTMVGYLPFYVLSASEAYLGTDRLVTAGNISSYAPATDLGYTAATRVLTSSTGTDVTLPLSSSTAPGLLPTLGTSLQLARVNSAGTSLEYFTPSYLTAVTGTARFSGSGTSGSPLELAQQSAATGQGLGWNGAYWAPWTFFHTASSRFSGAGTAASPLELAQQSATTGQVLTWNGTSWAPATATGGVTGSGTANYLPKWSSGTALGNSVIYDSGTSIGIGTTSPQTTLEVVSNNVAAAIIRNPTASSYTSYRLYNDQNTGGRALQVAYGGSAYPGALMTNGPTGESGYISTGAYPLSIGTDFTARLTIMPTTGYIGLSTAAPAKKLEIVDASKAQLRLTYAANTTYADLQQDAVNLTIKSTGSVGLYPGGTVGLDVTSSYVTAYKSLEANSTSIDIGRSGQYFGTGYLTGLNVGSGLLKLPDGSAAAPALTWSSDTNNGIYRPTADVLGFTTDGAERMRVSATGNVGIGTTSPGARMHLNTTTSSGAPETQLTLENDANNTGEGVAIDFKEVAGYMGSIRGVTGSNATKAVTIAAGDTPTEIARFSVGGVGIGNTSPSEKLDVTGNVRFSGALMPNNAAGTAGQVLTSAGAGAPPTWASAGTIGGTAAANRVAYGDGTNSLTGSANFTYTSGILEAARSAGASIRVAYSAGSVYTDIGTNSSGYGFLSPTGKRLGVNTTAPSSTLHLQNDGTNTQGGLFIDHNSGTMSTGNELQLDLALGGTAMARVAAVKESTGYGLKLYTGGAGAVNGAAAIAITGADDITIGTTASTASINFQGPLGTDDYQTETANSGTLAAKSWHYIDPTGAATRTLPSSMNDGTWLFVVNQDGTFDITISAPGGETLTGSATITAGKTGMFHKSGTVWYRITF